MSTQVGATGRSSNTISRVTDSGQKREKERELNAVKERAKIIKHFSLEDFRDQTILMELLIFWWSR